MLVSVFSVVTLAVASVVAAPQKGYSYHQETVVPLVAEEATLQEQVVEPDSTNLVDDQDHHHHDDHHHDHHVGLDWLRDSVPGEPGVDYPIFWEIPRTSFRCRGRQTGYYADIETRCQVFHICNPRGGQAFLCPNGTIFDQQHFTCKWWFTVSCQDSEGFFDLNNNIGIPSEKQETQVVGFGQKEQQTGQQEIQQDVQQEVRPIILPDQVPISGEGVFEVAQSVPQESVSTQQIKEALPEQEPEEDNTIIGEQNIATGTISAEVEDATIRQVINQLFTEQEISQNPFAVPEEALEKPSSCGQGSVDCEARPSEGVSQLYGVPSLTAGESVSVHTLPQETPIVPGPAVEEANFIVPGVASIGQEFTPVVQENVPEVSPALSVAPRYDDAPETVFQEGISQFPLEEQEEQFTPVEQVITDEEQFAVQDQVIVQGEDQITDDQLVTVSTVEEQFPVQTGEPIQVIQREEYFPIQDEEQVPHLNEVVLVPTQLPTENEEQYTVQDEELAVQTAIPEEAFPTIPVQEEQIIGGEEQTYDQDEEQVLGEDQIFTTQAPTQDEENYHEKSQEYVPYMPEELRIQYENEYLDNTEDVSVGYGYKEPSFESEFPMQWRVPVQMQQENNHDEGQVIVVDDHSTQLDGQIPIQGAGEEVSTQAVGQEEAIYVQLQSGEQIPVYNEEPSLGQGVLHSEGQFVEKEEQFPVYTEEAFPVDVDGQLFVTTAIPEQFEEEQTYGFNTDAPFLQTADTSFSQVPSTFIIEIPSEIIEAPAQIPFSGNFQGYATGQEVAGQSDITQEGVTSLYELQNEYETTQASVTLENELISENTQQLCNGISCSTEEQEYSTGIAVDDSDFAPQLPQLTKEQFQDTLSFEENVDDSSESSEETYEETDAVTTTVSPVDLEEQNETFQIDIRHEIPESQIIEGEVTGDTQVNLIHQQVPQLYEVPVETTLTEESQASFLPDVQPEVVSTGDVPKDSVVSLLHRGETSQNATTARPQENEDTTDAPATEYNTIFPETREDTTASVHIEATTVIPSDEEEVSTLFSTVEETPATYEQESVTIFEQEPVPFEEVPQEPVTFDQVPQEPVTFDQVPQEPVTFDQVPQEPVTVELEPQEPFTFDQGPQEPVTLEQEPQESFTFDQAPQEPVTFDQVPQEPVTLEQEPQEPATFDQAPQEPVTFDQVPQEPVTLEQEPQEPSTFYQAPQEPATFDQAPQEPATFDQAPKEPATFDQAPQEPATFDQAPQEPVTFDQAPQEPATFDQAPQEPATFDQAPQEPATFDQAPQEPATFDQAPQEPATFDQAPQEPATFDQVPEQPVILNQVSQEPVIVEQEPQEPVTFDQVPLEPVILNQVPQEPVTFDQEPQEPVVFEQELKEPITYEQAPQEPVTVEEEPRESITFDHGSQEPVILEQVPQEPVSNEQVPQEPFTFGQEPQEPVTFDQLPQEPVTFEQEPQEPLIFEPVPSEQFPQEPVTFDQLPQEPVSFDQVPQEPITLNQVPQEPVTFEQVPQEPITLNQVPQEPITLNQVPQEPVTFEQVPQEPITLNQVPQEPITFEEVPQEPLSFDQSLPEVFPESHTPEEIPTPVDPTSGSRAHQAPPLLGLYLPPHA